MKLRNPPSERRCNYDCAATASTAEGGTYVAPLEIAFVAFSCIFGSAMLGFLFRALVPDQHLSAGSQDAMKLVIGLVSTMCALVLGLMVASAKNSFDAQTTSLYRVARDSLELNRVLASYGPDTEEVRDILRRALESLMARVWPDQKQTGVRLKLGSKEGEVGVAEIQRRLYSLSPTTDEQKRLQGNALTMIEDIAQARWSAMEQPEHSIPPLFLVVLVFWLSMIFFGYNLFTPNSKVVAATMFAGALCMSSAIFLILELDSPLEGFLRLSPAPLIDVLAKLGQMK